MTKRLQIALLSVFAALLCVALAVGCVLAVNTPVSAATESDNGATLTFNQLTDFAVSEDGTTVNGLSDASLELITDRVENVIVDMSGEAFNAVTTIGTDAFRCGYGGNDKYLKIKQFNLPSQLQSIESSAFNTCTFPAIHLPDTITSIGQNAFNSSKLEWVNIPKNLEKTSQWKCFAVKSELTVHIDDRDSIFEFCPGDFDNVQIKSIEVSSLDTWLNKVKITSSSTVFRDTTDLMINGERLQGVVTIPAGTTKIGDYAFAGYKGITKLIIPESVETIGSRAFRNNTIAEVVFDNLENSQLTSISSGVFAGTRLVEFVIPKNVTVFHKTVFGVANNAGAPLCANLRKIYNLSGQAFEYNKPEGAEEVSEYNGEKPFVDDGNGFMFLDGDTPALYMYNGEGGDITLPQDFNGKRYNISEYAFAGNTSITGITIPANSAKIIGANAFNGSGIERITFNGGVESIGTGVFKNCASLTSVEFNNSTITEIADEAFYGCTKLNAIVIPATVEKIGDLAYAYCENALELTFNGSNVKHIGYGAFAYTSSLTEATIPDSVTTAGSGKLSVGIGYTNSYIFNNGNVWFANSGITRATIECSVESMQGAFAYCQNLAQVSFAESVTVKDVSLMYIGCAKLTDAVLPDGVEYFYGLLGQDSYAYALTLPQSIFSDTFDAGNNSSYDYVGDNYNIYSPNVRGNSVHDFTINLPEMNDSNSDKYGKTVADFLVNFDKNTMLSRGNEIQFGDSIRQKYPVFESTVAVVANKAAYDAVIAAMTEDWYNGTWIMKLPNNVNGASGARKEYTLDYLKSKVYYLTDVTYEVYKADGTTLLASETGTKLMQNGGASAKWALVTDKNGTKYYSLDESRAMPAKIGDYETTNGKWYVGNSEVDFETYKVTDGVTFKSVLDKVVVNVSDAEKEYDGNAWTVAADAPYTVKVITDSQGEPTARAINAGTYNVTYELKDKDGQQFANGESEITIKLTVTPKAAEVIWTYKGENISSDNVPSKVYDGKAISADLAVTFTGVDGTVTIDNETELFRYLNNVQVSSATGVGLWRLEIPVSVLAAKYSNYSLTHVSQQFRIVNISLSAQEVLGGLTIDLEGAATLNSGMLYIYEDNSHSIIPSRTPISQSGYTLVEVINVQSSIIRYTNRDWTLNAVVASSNADKFALDADKTANNVQKAIGRQTTTFAFNAKDNYEFALSINGGVAERGLTFTVSEDGKTLTVTKTWYVVQLANELVKATYTGTDEPADSDLYTVANWTYGQDVSFTLPRLWHGDEGANWASDDSRVKFTLTMQGVADPIVNNADRSVLLNYLNKYMPAGTYTLTVTVSAFDTDTASYPTFTRGYAFTVAKAVITIDESKLPKNENTGYADYEWELTSNANKELFFKNFAEKITADGVLNTVVMKDTVNNANYWMNEGKTYFGNYKVKYNFARMNNERYELANNNYLYEFISGGARGTYTVYFQVEMPNHENLTNVGSDGRYAYFFTVTVFETVDPADIHVENVTYTGLKNVPALSETDVYHVVLDENDKYIDGGEHTLYLVLNDSVHYRWKGVAAGETGLAVKYTVNKAFNEFLEAPDVVRWVEGKFNEEENGFIGASKFGSIVYVITDTDDNVIFDLAQNVDKRAEMKAGTYILKATVAGNGNYNGLTESFTIRILDKIGLPWWGTTLIAVGALAVAAAIILVLWKLKVFEILTDKISLAITTRATVDATIAAVRANKVAEESKAHVNKVKARERLEAAREAERGKTPEQKAQELQAKAEVTATKADKMHAKANKLRERADKLAGKTEQDVTETTDEQ